MHYNIIVIGPMYKRKKDDLLIYHSANSFYQINNIMMKWTTYDKVSAIVQISLPLAAYFDIPQIAVKIDFFKQNHQLL